MRRVVEDAPEVSDLGSMSRGCADDGNGSMAKLDLPKWVMAAINFKGGTGKTTVALAIAEGICRLLKKRVAVIDCDFQCSASIALLGRRTLNDLISKNATMDSLLQRKLTEGNGAHLGSSAVKTHFSIKEAAGLMHLLPGSPDMPRRERQIVASFLPRSDLHSAYENAAIRMGELFRSLLDEFDFILIDCPPGLTLFSEAAIRAADGLVIPTLPNGSRLPPSITCVRRSSARGWTARSRTSWSGPSFPRCGPRTEAANRTWKRWSGS
jgi:Mrp family chromosome partitioning ATPase